MPGSESSLKESPLRCHCHWLLGVNEFGRTFLRAERWAGDSVQDTGWGVMGGEVEVQALCFHLLPTTPGRCSGIR